MTAGIYMLRNTATGRVYVGSGRNVRERLANHRSLFARGTHPVKAMQADWTAHGPDAFVFEAIETTADDRSQRRHTEQRWLDQIHPDLLYNQQRALIWPCPHHHGACISPPWKLNGTAPLAAQENPPEV